MNVEDILQIGHHIEIKRFDKNSFLLINNNTEKYIKINESYQKIIEQIDGKKTVTEIVKAFNKTNKKQISEQNGIQILEKLDQIGLFSESESPHKKKKLPNYISFGFIFFPKNWVGKIIPYLKFLFNKKVVMFSILFCSIFLIYLFYHSFSSKQTFNFLHILPFYFLVSFIATMFHELGHATATHFYKAKYGGIGFGFYLYFMPVFFADVTDIWRLDKWKRIVVNASGVYFEVLFCGILALLSFYFNNTSLLAIVSILSLRTLYNLLPYFRTDGYWILSDYLNQPSLLATSFKKAKELLLLKFKNFIGKDYFLAFYGVFNFGLMTYFIGYMILFHSIEIIQFPKEVIHFFTNFEIFSLSLNIRQISKYVPVLLFYFFGFRIIINLVKKRKNPNNSLHY